MKLSTSLMVCERSSALATSIVSRLSEGYPDRIVPLVDYLREDIEWFKSWAERTGRDYGVRCCTTLDQLNRGKVLPGQEKAAKTVLSRLSWEVFKRNFCRLERPFEEFFEEARQKRGGDRYCSAEKAEKIKNNWSNVLAYAQKVFAGQEPVKPEREEDEGEMISQLKFIESLLERAYLSQESEIVGLLVAALKGSWPIGCFHKDRKFVEERLAELLLNEAAEVAQVPIPPAPLFGPHYLDRLEYLLGISEELRNYKNPQEAAKAIADSPLGREFSETCREVLVGQKIPAGLSPKEASKAIIEAMFLTKIAFWTRVGDAWPEVYGVIRRSLEKEARGGYLEEKLTPVTLPLRGEAGYKGGYAADRHVGEVTFGVIPELAEKFQSLKLTANQVGQVCRFPDEQDPRQPTRNAWCSHIASGGDEWEKWRWNYRGLHGMPEEFFVRYAAVKVLSGRLF